MKTTAMTHQVTGWALLDKNDSFLLACEQGTGKTWMLLADAEQRFANGNIDALLVVCPNGLQFNWVRREIPTHLECEHFAVAHSSGMGKRATEKLERIFRDDGDRKLRILAMSIDSINTPKGYALAERFLLSFRCVMAIDESSRIKNPKAKRTEKVIALGRLAKVRRCASGTPITNSPGDAFAQFEFLGHGLLGTTSYRAFYAEYTRCLPVNNRFVLDVVARKKPHLVQQYRAALAAGDDGIAADLLRSIARFAPQIAATDVEGRPLLKNLDKLSALMAPHMYRVTKKECLDLPEKIYGNMFFELSPEQRRLYDFLNENLRIVDEETGEVDIFTALTKQTKLQQITSGFIIDGDDARYLEEEATPRITALMEAIEDVDGKFIVWARYREEIAHICRELRAAGIEVVEYHGGVKRADREIAVDSIQEGTARAFVGNAQSGGIGLTLTKAETVIYYSNDFNLETRLQSEDRAHRIGTVRNVNYIDLVANDTIDEKIALALQRKEEVAAILLGDR